jgi:hypothetical protein
VLVDQINEVLKAALEDAAPDGGRPAKKPRGKSPDISDSGSKTLPVKSPKRKSREGEANNP